MQTSRGHNKLQFLRWSMVLRSWTLERGARCSVQPRNLRLNVLNSYWLLYKNRNKSYYNMAMIDDAESYFNQHFAQRDKDGNFWSARGVSAEDSRVVRCSVVLFGRPNVDRKI